MNNQSPWSGIKQGDSAAHSPHAHQEARTLALRVLSEEMVEALLARLRLLRGRPSSIQPGDKRSGVSAADPAGDRDRVRGSEVRGG